MVKKIGAIVMVITSHTPRVVNGAYITKVPCLTKITRKDTEMKFNTDWTIEDAKSLAKAKDFELDYYQIAVIEIVRAYYLEYRIYPSVSVIRRRIRKKFGQYKGLYSIFPDTLNSEIARYAGVPAPTGCL